MDLDNPSYFSVPDEKKFKTTAFKKRNRMGNSDSVSSASDCSLTPPRSSFNREFRTFLRSVSSTSADSNQELLIKGEPRLSDIAPDLAFKHPASRSNSLKSREFNNQQQCNEVMYSPLPTSEEAAAELSSGDEIFLGEDSARYYNFQAVKSNNQQRRHSIGTFMGRERTNSVASSTSKSFKDEFSTGIMEDEVDGAGAVAIDDHSLRHASYPRKRCARCTKVAFPKLANMDDILIVSLKSSDPASLWVDYFSNYFQQVSKQVNRKPFKIQHLGAEDIKDTTEASALVKKLSNVKLQLVVLCPSFLEFINQHPDQCRIFGDLLLPDRTLALLLGVQDNDLSALHKEVLTTYFSWQRQFVGQDQDENFTKEFLKQAMTILSKVWKQQSSVSTQEKSCFSVTPKKIRQGQNSIFILLTYPLQKEDIVKISIEKNSEIIEIKSVKRRNPYVMKVILPENLTEVTAIINVLVEKNGSIIGSRPVKCESKLRELEQILRSASNPVEFMCQTLGFNPAERDHLDNWLVYGFQRNLPAHFNLLSNNNTPYSASVQVHKHSHEEFPTLLHFAAKFGLEKLCIQLLECPGAEIANEIRNIQDMTPAEIAEANQHSDLCSVLRGYMSINEFTNMYTKLKHLSQDPSTPEFDEEGYLTPVDLSDFYKNCPKPKLVPDTPTSETTIVATTPSTPPLGYMPMNTPAKNKDDLLPPLPPPQLTVPKSPKNKLKHDLPEIAAKPPKITNLVIEDKVQKELAEIINDFKNNVHSIQQVEKLVEEWKNRNDVQKSFKEKQEQLLQMRLKYEQIQQEMKTAMKKPTPFERIKKFFRGKSTPKQEVTSPNISFPSQRPISSLSTSSSSSSARMSTISGSSLGDSGTHSDNEDRKNMIASHSEDDVRNAFNKAIMELNYTLVPAPKPVRSNVFQNRKVFETIEEKPVRPENLEIIYDFYIQFPPSGLPVPGLAETEETAENSPNYMNVTPLQESHDYMNFKMNQKDKK